MEGLSQTICKSNIVLLTGAGASAPLGLRLMASFMDLLEEKMQKDAMADQLDLKGFLGKIYESKAWSGIKLGRDLESVLERLEDYQKWISLVEIDRNLSKRISQYDQYNHITKYASLLNSLTRDLIFEHYSEIGDKEVSQLYTDFLTILANCNGNKFLPIFTTNYDLAIERFVSMYSDKWSLVDGFENRRGHGDFWGASIYHKYNDNTSNNTADIILFKLHGSIFWYKRKGSKEIFRTPHPSRRDPTLENVLLYPAQTKNTLIEPFKTCYDYLENCLANCKVCVVVGYSFRDPYISEKIKLATRANKDLTLVVIDPGDVEKQVLSCLPEGRKWIPFRIGFEDIKKEDQKVRLLVRLSGLISSKQIS